jgi:uncharacterized OB-fold protein
VSDKPFRIQPAITPENEHFWKGGAEGELRFLRCKACSTYVHPPAPVCPECLGSDLGVEAVSGRARVLTYTVNHRPWIPDYDPPYVIAIVELPEQEGLRLTTNIVNCPIDDVRVDMPVRVVFDDIGDGIYRPLFEPESD